MTCIVAYDISSDRRRTRLARYLEGKGVRLQRSVFAVEMERHMFRKFQREVYGIAGKGAEVAIFRLCKGCMRNAVRSGGEEKKRFVCI